MFAAQELQLYNRLLSFLEDAYSRRGAYTQADPSDEKPSDVLLLAFTKVVNDCRAILLLAEHGFHIQGGILARSTEDAASLMMHIAFEGEDAALVGPWLDAEKVTHWDLASKLNEAVGGQLRLDSYARVRRLLDDFVHANYPALKLYPAQSPGPTPLDEDSLRRATLWTSLLGLYLTSCLLVVDLVAPDLAETAAAYTDELVRHLGVE